MSIVFNKYIFYRLKYEDMTKQSHFITIHFNENFVNYGRTYAIMNL